MSIKESASISDTRYIGSVCAKHPQLKGERRKASYVCVGCQRDKNKKHRKSLIGAHEHSEAMKEARSANTLARKIQETRQRQIKIRAEDICVKLGDSMRNWADYYQQAVDQLKKEGILPP
jgi:predicted Fe-S protein YdhL (DUF1289 family)